MTDLQKLIQPSTQNNPKFQHQQFVGGSSVTSAAGKETVLKRLLETQEIYIQELEAKCKSMTDQLTESPYKQNTNSSLNNNNKSLGGNFQTQQDKNNILEIDINAMVKHKKPFIDRLQWITSHYEAANRTLNDSTIKNFCDALNMIKQDAQIELEVYQQRDQQNQGLIKTMQQKFSQERKEFMAQFEQTENQLHQKVLALEQEVAVLTRQVKKQSATEEDLNAEVLHELETLEARYKQSDEELRQENSQLRKQVAAQLKQTREIQSQLISTKQQLDVKNFEQFTQLKRLEETLKQIRGEVKQAFRVLESHVMGATGSMIQQQEISFQSTNADHLNKSNEESASLNQNNLQKELELAYQEIDMLQQSNMSEIWQSKLELVEKEKQLIADELQKIAKGFQAREQSLLKDLKAAQQQIKSLQNNQTKRENQLQLDLNETRIRLKDIIISVNNLNNMPSEIVQSPKIESKSETDLLNSQNEQLKAHNLILRTQLQEALILAGRCSSVLASNQSIEKQLGYASSQHKISQRVLTIQNMICSTLDRVEKISSEMAFVPILPSSNEQSQSDRSPTQQDSVQLNLQLNQAKKSLMLYINKCNQLEELLDSDFQLDQSQIKLVLVKKFAIEIQQLKQELADAQNQKEEIQTQLRKQIDQLQSSAKVGGASNVNREIEQIKIELRSCLNDLRHCMSQFQECEQKNLQEKIKNNQVLRRQTNQLNNSNTSKDSAQQTLGQGKASVYDEILQLRQQIDQMSEAYEKQAALRDAELQNLSKAKIAIQTREEQLVALIRLIQQISSNWLENSLNKNQTTDEEAQEYQRQIEQLKSELLQTEQRVRGEHEGKTGILAQKLQLLEAQKDLLTKENEHFKQQTEQLCGPKKALQLENDRLKKHILSRQQEITEMRQKTQNLKKQLMQKSADIEQDLLKKYKDRMSGHLKVFDLELSKLQSIVNINIA